MASDKIKDFSRIAPDFESKIENLYKDVPTEEAMARYAKVYESHYAKYGRDDFSFFSSPGRIELCGNHTDHNHGKVLCAAITVDTLACVTPNDNRTVTVNSFGYAPFTVSLNVLSAVESEKGTSLALVKGVLKYFADNGYNIGGFDMTATSSVFKGAGVSSSACFEVLIAQILNVYYNDSKIEPIRLAMAAQYAENVYFGKPCGLMDQSAIALGGVSYIDFEDPTAPKVESVPWRLGNRTEIVLINCGGDHCNLTDEYAAIRTEMESIAGYFGKKTLREITREQVMENVAALYRAFGGRAVLRALHFFNENELVVRARDAVKNSDADAFLTEINATGDSSYKMLQNCYPKGDTLQPIPLAIAVARETRGLQAIRVHGGGFAGTVLAFCHPDNCADFVAEMSDIFGKENVFPIGIRNSGAKLVFKAR